LTVDIVNVSRWSRIAAYPDRGFSLPSWQAVFKTKKQAGIDAGLSELVFAAPDGGIARNHSDSIALDSRQSPFVESEEHPAPHVDFTTPNRLATRTWVTEKRDYKRVSQATQQGSGS
jgi:hypothetical protein